MTAIRHALNVLSWLEMREEDQPSPEIWLNSEAINAHMERIQEKYRSPDNETVEDLDQNELTRNLRRR